MPADPQRTAEVALALRDATASLQRRLRQTRPRSGLSWSESSALQRLGQAGPMTSATLARIEQISPQSMGVVLKGLEARGMVERRHDPDDGRRILFSISATGAEHYRSRLDVRREQMRVALESGFSAAEIEQLGVAAPLLERLGERLFALGNEEPVLR